MSGALRSLRSASCWRIENRFFTEQRILVCASTAAVAYAIGLAWRFGAGGSPKCIDFTSMWVSGSFAGSSDPAQMYDNSAWLASWKGLTGLGDCILAQGHTSYPPTLLFFTYPLGLMPYALAFVVWMAATLLLYLAAVYAIVPRSAVIIAALTPYTSPFNVLLGQNGFLTAGLIGLSLVFIERRPWLSGIFLGLLTYKPQFGVLFPLALVASRNWRALISATASSLVIGLAAAVVFGHQTWPFFVDSLLDRDAGLGSDHVELSIQSVLGLLHWMGAGAETSWAAHLAVAATLALTIWLIWAQADLALLGGAALCIGSVMFTPYVLAYDLCILSIVAAFLVSDCLSRGFLPASGS
jgi:hypothetical protein